MNQISSRSLPIALGRVWCFVRKDACHLRAIAFGAWLCCGLTQVLTYPHRSEQWDPGSLATTAFSCGCWIFAYLGAVHSATLDCPWSRAAFAYRRPVDPSELLLAKFISIGALLVLPALLCPFRAAPMLTNLEATAGTLQIFALVVGSGTFFRHPFVPLVMHASVAFTLVAGVTRRITLAGRWDGVGPVLIFTAGCVALFISVVRIRTRGVATVVVVAGGVGLLLGFYTVKRF